MRRLLVAAVAGALAATSFVPAEAGTKRRPQKVTRTAEAVYLGAARSWTAVGPHNVGGAKFPTEASERYVSITIEDDAGMDVSAAVQVPVSDDTVERTYFCTATDGAVEITPGADVIVFVYAGPCTHPQPAPALATRGKIFATFSNLP